mmetsp:Transcript_100905/g.281090  ORF Transcript_100905/g.281090 Transcript_100905/m.281090 type:complete len:82 (-) Transcript_100905:86-331(-)
MGPDKGSHAENGRKQAPPTPVMYVCVCLGVVFWPRQTRHGGTLRHLRINVVASLGIEMLRHATLPLDVFRVTFVDGMMVML